MLTTAAEQAEQRAGYESAAAFREDDRPPLENSTRIAVPGPSTEDYEAMTSYVKALEQYNQELRSVGGRSIETTSLSETHEVSFHYCHIYSIISIAVLVAMAIKRP